MFFSNSRNFIAGFSQPLKWKVRIYNSGSATKGKSLFFISDRKKTNFKLLNFSGLLANRKFSTNNGNNTKDIKPKVIYDNADIQKEQIFKENKEKSGVYRWINKLNGDSYIGSAVDLNKRLYHYYSLRLMELYLKKRKSYIFSALIKYGYSNFTLEILEYCDKIKVIEREQFYIDLLCPKYNLLKVVGSRFGVKHSDDTLRRLEKMSLSQKGHKGSVNHPKAKKIMVTDLKTNTSICYDSVNLAAKALNCGDSSILKNLNSKKQKPYKGRYVFKLL